MKTKYAVRLETRMVKEPDFPYDRAKIDSVAAVAEFAKTLMDSDIEKFLILHLNNKLVINCIQVFNGTTNRAPVFIREIIKHNINSASDGMIIIHNHPAGTPIFSEEDINVTKEIISACKLLEIRFLDHVLLVNDFGALSMVDQGII